MDRFDTERPVSDQLFVVDRDRLTCSGGQGAAHLAAFLVARHIGQAAATKSLNIMMIDEAMGGERPQPAQVPSRRARDPLVKRAVHAMVQNIEVPKTLNDLAAGLGVGRRTLERRFVEDLGQTPQKVYVDLRLEKACARLRQGTDSIAEIALSCGFCDASHLSRVMKANRGTSPAEYRKATR